MSNNKKWRNVFIRHQFSLDCNCIITVLIVVVLFYYYIDCINRLYHY